VQRLDNAAKFGEGAGQRGRAVADLQDAHDGTGMDAAKLERSGQAQQILPVSPDEFDVDAIAREAVEGAIIGASVDAPEAGVADISEACLPASRPALSARPGDGPEVGPPRPPRRIAPPP
jgi:hypothetical protein